MKNGFIVVVASVALSAIAAYYVSRNVATPSATSAEVRQQLGNRSVNLSVSDYPDFTFAAESAVDAVVYVAVAVPQRRQQVIDPFFRFFFGDDGSSQGQGRMQRGSGSGVIIRSDGYIVTNNHVVDGAAQIEVTLNDNTSYPARVVGTDPATDVALLKIEAQGLPTVEFADSDALRLGEWVLAIGSPLELRSTITAGIVSAKGRTMPNYTGEFKIESFIQTDAAVNPGNSGGALVNKAGELVGINTAIISSTGSYSGYSFAIPSNIVKKIASDIIDFGEVRRARLGVVIAPIDEKMVADLKLSSLDGVYIVEVERGSAAESAGLRSSDVILDVDSVPVKSPSALQEKVNAYRPGDSIVLDIVRNGEHMTVQLDFAAQTTDKII